MKPITTPEITDFGWIERERVTQPVSKSVMKPASKLGLKNRVQCQVIDSSTGQVVEKTPWFSNLILDQGLDNIATMPICDLFLYCCNGTDTTPVEQDSGATTGSTTGTTMTITGGSFTFSAGDVGELIRFDTGEEAYIASFTGASEVELDDTLGVTSQLFTMYGVDQTGLGAEDDRTNNYLTGAPDCESTRSGSVITHRRTFDFGNPVGNTTYEEVGFSHSASQTNNLNSRALISGGVSVTTSQQLRVIYEFQVTLSPTSPSAKTFSITNWPVAPALGTDGDEQFGKVGLSAVNSGTGATTTFDITTNVNEPSVTSTTRIWLSTSDAAQGTFPTAVERSSGQTVATSVVSLSSYSSGSFLIDKSVTFAVGEANGTEWRSMGICSGSSPGVPTIGFDCLFDEDQTKENTHTLTLAFRYSWQRDFS